MKRSAFIFFLLLAGPWSLAANSCPTEAWGFFGHRRINRLAVFTVPPPLNRFYKKHIEYITEHAVDADKRRYASRHEAVRHYIDLDRWGQPPFDNLPRTWEDALVQHTYVALRTPEGDTLELFGNGVHHTDGELVWFSHGLLHVRRHLLRYSTLKLFYRKLLLPQYYEDSWQIPCDSLQVLLSGERLPCARVLLEDRLSEHGILPWHLTRMYGQLVRAFEAGDVSRLLRLSADIGHYIGDAHVPLHTTENYNGQLTGQHGIHAFWESRLPELFADDTYDFWVGPAQYIEDPQSFFWGIVLESHRLVDSVLQVEARLRREFPADQQYCMEERGQGTLRTQCRAYAEAYHRAMGDMVERRMRASVHALGSVWYSAWLDAGSPNLGDSPMAELPEAEDTEPPQAPVTGIREHEGG
jgi:hypothetical protein